MLENYPVLLAETRKAHPSANAIAEAQHEARS